MAHSNLKSLFHEAFRQLSGHGRLPKDIDVRFYPYAGLHHTIRVRSGRVYVRISDIASGAPADVYRSLAFILVAKLLGKRTPDVHEHVYRSYATSDSMVRASDLARQRRGRKKVTSSRGRVYDLEKIFQRLNREYFGGKIPAPSLTWSQRRTRRILGHHDAVHETIVISKTLDSREIPLWFVEYVLYHEMLHIKHPARLIRGRRYYHTNAFRAEEQRFAYYAEAQDLIDQLAHQNRLRRARAA